MELKNITENLILEYVEKYDKNEGTYLADQAITQLFGTFPNNIEIKDILLKVGVIDNFYSTHLYATFTMAKHIQDLGVDSYIKTGDPKIVNLIANITISGKLKKCYSFATKYCSWHNQNEYPIFDRYVENILVEYQKKDSFSKFKKDELRNYIKFKNTLEDFRKYYRVENLSFRQIDKFLWLHGKEIIKLKEQPVEEVPQFIDNLKSLKTAFEYKNDDENETIRGAEFEGEADDISNDKGPKKSITIIKTTVGKPKEIKSGNKDGNNYLSRSFEAESKIEVKHSYRILKKRSDTKDNRF
ncbi:hypothetical protein KKF70_00760 [bacterium]|nr:hypothetical protein [bacterium]MBU3929258.1 hypothetical protein [bacterium]